MKRLVTAAAAALTACVVATSASAQDFEFFEFREGWNIFRSTATGGCFMERQTEEGIVLQVGSLQTMTGAGGADDFGYLGIYIPGEAPENAGGDPLLVLESGPNRYIAEAHSQERQGFWGGFIVSGTGSDLANDLRTRKSMRGITVNGGGFDIDLTRTNINRALDRTAECQNQS
ncbi:MAG: hypothetical protein AAGK37_05855 [Pseudomonadota bacterium]